MGMAAGIGLPDDIRHHHERATLQRLTHAASIGKRNGRIGRHDPQRLDPPLPQFTEQIDRLEARLGCHAFGCPEAADIGDILFAKSAMRRQGRGEPTHFASAHRIGLARNGKGRCARFADPPGGEMQVDDRIDLIRAADRLVDALTE